jgi:transposase-like protein
MECPKCKSQNYNKDGIVRGLQRYKCKECNYRYTVILKSTAKSKDIKRQALELYLEGLGYRSIGRFLKVSHVSVQNWIKSFGEQVEKIKSDNEIEVVEIDEIHTYIKNKKTIVGYGMLLIDMEKSLSTSLWVQGEHIQEKNSGKK